MQTTSVNRFQSKPVCPAKLFLVPRPAVMIDTKGPVDRLMARMPAVSKDQLITGALALTTFWAAHLLLEHVFHL